MNNTTVLLTGATSGIGRSIALQLAKQGFNLALCGRDKVKMDSLLAELAALQGKVHAQTFNLIDEQEIIRFVEQSVQALGSIDILINCAGANTAREKIENLQTADLEYMIKLNAIAPFVFIRSVIPMMQERKSGMVINILSSACLFAVENAAGYIASKSTLDALSKVLRKEMRPHNVKVCSVYPGGVDTPFRTNVRPDYLHPDTVATAVVNAINLPPEAAIDEIVLRPFVETNYR